MVPHFNAIIAVFFLVRRKKSFYIGCVTGENGDNTVKLKFLERKLVGSQFVYDWPRRDDVCCVERSCVKRSKFQSTTTIFA